MAELKKYSLIFVFASLVLFLLFYYLIFPYMLRFSESELRDWINTGQQKIYDASSKGYLENVQSIILKDSIVSSDGGEFKISSSSIGVDRYNKVVYWNASINYAVDRYSRKNIPGVDGLNRKGYFMFPPNTKKADYIFESPEVLEKEGMVKFEGEVDYKGYKVYNFSYSLDNLDKTQFFPLISKDNKIIGSHRGSMLVEPKSGVILYFEHSGVNKLYDSSGKYMFDYEIWDNSFNQFTSNNQIGLADKLYNRNSIIQVVNIILFVVFILSLIFCAYSLIARKLYS